MVHTPNLKRERISFVEQRSIIPPYLVIGRIGSWSPSCPGLQVGALIKLGDLLRRIGLPVDKAVSLTSLHHGLKVGILFNVLNSYPMVNTLMLSKGRGGRDAHDWQSSKARRNRVVGVVGRRRHGQMGVWQVGKSDLEVKVQMLQS